MPSEAVPVDAFLGIDLGTSSVKVLLVDADLRKARVHKALKVDNDSGLTNCLVGTSTLEVREAMGLMAVENLRAFFAGEPVPNPV